MPYDTNGKKWACMACIQGHRVQECTHYEQVMVHVRPPGRPSKNCKEREFCFMMEIRREKNATDKHPISICKPRPQPAPGAELATEVEQAQQQRDMLSQQHRASQLQGAYMQVMADHAQREADILESHLKMLQSWNQVSSQGFAQPMNVSENQNPYGQAASDPHAHHAIAWQCAPHTQNCCRSTSTAAQGPVNAPSAESANETPQRDAGTANEEPAGTASRNRTHRTCRCPSKENCICIGCEEHPFNPGEEAVYTNLVSDWSVDDFQQQTSHNANAYTPGDRIMAVPAQIHTMHLHGQPNGGLAVVNSQTTMVPQAQMLPMMPQNPNFDFGWPPVGTGPGDFQLNGAQVYGDANPNALFNFDYDDTAMVSETNGAYYGMDNGMDNGMGMDTQTGMGMGMGTTGMPN